MDTIIDRPKVSLEDLEEVIANAIKKVGARGETELCRYLPGEEGYLHHFSLKKMKKQNPAGLKKMIKENILDQAHPRTLPPKPRIRLKKTPETRITASQIAEMLKLAKEAGNAELIKHLSLFHPLQNIQNQLIQSIREKKIDQELWDTYVSLLKDEGLAAVK